MIRLTPANPLADPGLNRVYPLNHPTGRDKAYACAAAAWHAKAVAKIKEKAAQRATDLKEIIDGIKRSGMTTRG